MAHKDRELHREYCREYYRKNQERLNNRHKEYYKANREKCRAMSDAYKKAHREEVLERAAKYRELHREEHRIYQMNYRAAHREELNQRAREYRAAHREEINRRYRERYAQKKLEKLLAMKEEKLRKEDGYFKPKKESPIVGGKTFRLDTCPVCGSREVGRIGNKSYFCRSCFREITQHKIYYYDKEGIRRLES